jgi:uncharacterized protein
MISHARSWGAVCGVGLLAAALVGVVGGCGGGNTGDKVRPKDPSAKNALDEDKHVKECTPAPGEPLVIDLRSSDRSDFEVAMQDGVAVVSYNCKDLKLLKSCNLHSGVYTYAVVNRKEDIVQMESRDEVEANMPISGAKLSAALKSGSTIDLALITVGKRKTVTKGVYLDDLQGECDGATHVIRGAYIGAFAMGTGTQGHASAVADMFGIGASGKSTADKKQTRTDGDLIACRKAAPDATSPPQECGAITRLDLVPLKKRPPGSKPPPREQPDEPPVADADSMPAPPGDLSASSSSSSTSKSAGKKPSSSKPSKTAGKKPGVKPSSASNSAAPPPPMPNSSSASAGAATEADEAPETPQCAPGLSWNGVICKKK